jgi:excisionase family DNA binding protein
MSESVTSVPELLRKQPKPEYLTIDGVAELLGRNRKAIEKMVERRQIPFRKHGKRIVLIRSELTEFFDKLPGVTLEEAERRVEERVGRGSR